MSILADVFGLKVMIANCGRQVYFVEDKGKITINPDYTVTGGELIGEVSSFNTTMP
jgi:hypothetical protein